MRVYLVCTRRRGRPKVALEVCKACRYNRACSCYFNHRNPPLFPEIEKSPGNAGP